MNEKASPWQTALVAVRAGGLVPITATDMSASKESQMTKTHLAQLTRHAP